MTDKEKILATGALPSDLVDMLEEQSDFSMRNQTTPMERTDLLKEITDKNGVICLLGDVVDKELLDLAPKLRIVANVAVGFDNIDVAEATKRGIVVLNTPGVLDAATADLTMGLLISCARRICESDRVLREGGWQGWDLNFMLGADLESKTLGILGMGRIGQAVARRAHGFGLRIIYTRTREDEKDELMSNSYAARRVDLSTLLKESDFLSIHCPLNAQTRHMIGKAELATMKASAYLINTARGAIVNQEALIDALRMNTIAGAGLDVFEGEPYVPDALMQMENVVLTPHIGSATQETRYAMKRLAVQGLLSVLDNKMPKNVVNPEVWPSLSNNRVR